MQTEQGSEDGRPFGCNESIGISVLGALPGVSVLVFDRDLRYVLCAGGALGDQGLSPQDLENRLAPEVLAPERWPLYEPLYRAALEGEQGSIELADPTGSRWYRVDVAPRRDADGAIAGGIAVARDITERRSAEAELAASRSLLQDILDSLPTAVSVKDINRRFILINRAYEEARDVRREDVVGKTLHDLYPPEVAERFAADDDRALADGAVSDERDLARPDGTTSTYLLSRSPLRRSDGEIYGLCAISHDVSDRKLIENALQEAQQLFEQAFDQAPIGMALVDLEGRWMRVNRALCDITGYDEPDLLAKTFAEITHPDDVEADVEHQRRLVAGMIREYQTQKRYFNKQGKTIWVHLSVSAVRGGEGRAEYFIVHALDISRQKRLEQRLRNLADNDSLTGLPNRRYFEEALAVQVGRCQRYDETAALLMLDIDHFKSVNDRFGHRAGDDLLKAVADAIRRRIRASDLAGRLGGDEFAVLLLHPATNLLSALAADLADAVSAAAIEIGGERISATASVGVTFIDADTADADQALARADDAMYAEKARHAEQPPPHAG